MSQHATPKMNTLNLPTCSNTDKSQKRVDKKIKLQSVSTV